MIKQALLDGLEQTRTNYDDGEIRLTSGYRCPHGNAAVGGDTISFHMHGRAADMKSADYEWTRQEFNKLQRAARETDPSPVNLTDWSKYPDDRHLHAAW